MPSQRDPVKAERIRLNTLLSKVTREALKAAGVRKGHVEAGYRDAPGVLEPTCDARLWAEDSDLYDVCTLTPSDVSRACVFDLYVYDDERHGGELTTNVCAVVSDDGELLACFDSVSAQGCEWAEWWENTLSNK